MYEKTTLPNGVRILHEHIPHVRSVSMGIWVSVGSRHERAAEYGASHFIEHMLFKGTKTRTAAELAALMDGIGGQINAFTTKECTCFHGRVLDTHLVALVDILSDMFFNSVFSEADVENECGVIFEEIDMYSDTPDDLVSERLLAAVYKGHSLGRPILGKRTALEKMSGASLMEYKNKHYTGGRVVIALSGSYTKDDIKLICDAFSAIPDGAAARLSPPRYSPVFTAKRKALEQNHVCLGFEGLGVTDDERFTLQLLSDIFGGGMSSRLFQSVREKRGLCYSIYSYGTSYMDSGIFSVYTALGKDTETVALELIKDEIRLLLDGGVTEAELLRAREQVKSNILLGLESTSARMNRLGRNELYLGRVPSPEETIASYDAVTAEDILSLARRMLNYETLSLSAVGRVEPPDAYKGRFV